MSGTSDEDMQEFDNAASWEPLMITLPDIEEEQERRVWALNEARKVLIRNAGPLAGERLDAEEMMTVAAFILDGVEAVFDVPSEQGTDPAVINGVVESIAIEVDRLLASMGYSNVGSGVRDKIAQAIRVAWVAHA